MLMVMRRNGDIKSRRSANEKHQRVRINKREVSSPTPDFYSLKHTCGTEAKQSIDAATVDLLGFFLQTEANEDDGVLMLKLSRVFTSLLLESDKTLETSAEKELEIGDLCNRQKNHLWNNQ